MHFRFTLIALLIGIGSCQAPVEENKEGLPPESKTTETVKLADLDDNPISLEQFKGRTVFLNFWATWCKPCIREIPSIKNAKELLANKNVVFLLASDEAPELIKEFKNDHYPDLSYVRLLNMEALNFQALPTTYIFSPQGELAFAETGFRKWDDSTNIELLLKINNQK